eukprot:5563176-Amphidinium_carterae.1
MSIPTSLLCRCTGGPGAPLSRPKLSTGSALIFCSTLDDNKDLLIYMICTCGDMLNQVLKQPKGPCDDQGRKVVLQLGVDSLSDRSNLAWDLTMEAQRLAD